MPRRKHLLFRAGSFAVALLLPTLAPSAALAGDVCPAEGVDRVLRRCADLYPALELPLPEVSCTEHRERIEAFEFELGEAGAGTTYPWAQWAVWGEELFDRGFAGAPPAPPYDPGSCDPWPPRSPADCARSEPIGDFADYTCARCHNDRREDPVLTDQAPGSRYEYILEVEPDADYRVSDLKMTQGVTMWGGVNRVRFYNGLFSFFDSICLPTADRLAAFDGGDPPDCGGTRFAPCVPGCQQIDVADFGDAIQICSRYCGVGRFIAEWEELAMLTHFWDGQVRIGEVIDSLERQLARLESAGPPDGPKIAALRFRLAALRQAAEQPERPSADACQALSVSYLLTSCEDRRDASAADPDDPLCYRDWTPGPRPPSASVESADAADLPAMIEHLLSRAARTVALPPGVVLQGEQEPFVSDEGGSGEEPADPALMRGKRLYELSCGRCHGRSPSGAPQVGGRGHRFLAGSRYVFFSLVADGLTPKIPIPPNPTDPQQEPLYMPEFTLQRLSYRQVEEIYRYLESLPASGEIRRQQPTSARGQP